MSVIMIATTPFQVLTCSIIAHNNGYDADLYLGNRFNDSEFLYREIVKLNTFKNVILVDQLKVFDDSGCSKICKRIKLAKAYLNIKEIIEELIVKDRKYDKIYFSNNAILCRLFYLYFCKYKKNTEIILFDDGIGTYCDEYIYSPSVIERLYQKILLGVDICSGEFEMNVYSPELFNMSSHNVIKFNNIRKIDIDYDSSYKERLFNVLFQMDGKEDIKSKFIVLDSWKKMELNDIGIKKLSSFYDWIYDDFSSNVKFKTHPKDDCYNMNYSSFVPRGIPFEYYCSLHDFSNQVLITNLSTAAFTPKIIFNQEPEIVFLYRIFKNELLCETSIDNIVIRLKEVYKDKDKIHIPSTIEEAKELLNNKSGLGMRDE